MAPGGTRSVTILDEGTVTIDARVDGDRVWVDPAVVESATGWARKPEGLCRGAVCIPVRDPIDGDDGTVDIATIARAVGKDAVIDADRHVVAFADDPMGRGEVRNLHDVSLPGRDGRMVDLSGVAGKKVVLIAWASW